MGSRQLSIIKRKNLLHKCYENSSISNQIKSSRQSIQFLLSKAEQSWMNKKNMY